MPISERPDAAAPAIGLAAHAAHACRHRGVCCSSNWEIPVEAALHDRLAAALADGAVRPLRGGAALIPRADLPPDQRSVLGRTGGRCVFHGDGADACRLHAWGGPAAKPIACQQFPWIAVHDPRGTWVSLSHVCPTAAERLRDPALLVLAPLPHPSTRFDGLDVRRALPPALDARRLVDWDALTAWETQALDACARAAGPDEVLDDLRALLAHARRWATGAGPLAHWIAAWTPAPRRPTARWRPQAALDALVRHAAPPGLAVAPPLDHVEPPSWAASGTLVRRYLAARLVACWPLHYGTGLSTVVAYVEALLTVVATEIARRAPSPVADEAVTLAAMAEADRLVIHLAAPGALARALDAWAAGGADGGL